MSSVRKPGPDAEAVERALDRAADIGKADHWSVTVRVLADEVRRLRAELADLERDRNRTRAQRATALKRVQELRTAIDRAIDRVLSTPDGPS